MHAFVRWKLQMSFMTPRRNGCLFGNLCFIPGKALNHQMRLMDLYQPASGLWRVLALMMGACRPILAEMGSAVGDFQI